MDLLHLQIEFPKSNHPADDMLFALAGALSALKKQEELGALRHEGIDDQAVLAATQTFFSFILENMLDSDSDALQEACKELVSRGFDQMLAEFSRLRIQ